MTEIDRRRFLMAGGLTAAGLGTSGLSAVRQDAGAADGSADDGDRRVHLTGDGLSLTPVEYTRLLARLADERHIVADGYILGGVIDELETRFARMLGKERAVFMPTGTLANQLAVRALAGDSSRAVVQAESHLYMDSGDCVQTLSGITLMPLARGRATFTAAELAELLADTHGGRVLKRVGALQIETPVRRRRGETFDATELAAVVALARREGIRLHLDGARVFIQSAYSRTPVADIAAPFDTVYVSLYKYFNAAAGAVLAGPRALLDDMFHTRRMYGGALAGAWPYAAVALHYLEGFVERFEQAIAISEELIRRLSRVEGVTIERVPSGTNLFYLRVTRTDPAALRRRLADRNIMLGSPSPDGSVLVGVNESWTRMSAAELGDAFVRELA